MEKKDKKTALHLLHKLCYMQPYDLNRSFGCPALYWLAFTPEEGLDQAKMS